MTPATFDWLGLKKAIVAVGYADDIAWGENLGPPADAQEFAEEVIFVICNSGMKNTVARGIYLRVMAAVSAGKSANTAFGHKGKAGAIDAVWKNREALFIGYMKCGDKLAALESLPWIGSITKYHLAKNFGMQVAKPDVHLMRLAVAMGTTPQALCEVGAGVLNLKVATVDTLLWRAAALGILDTRAARLLGAVVQA